MTDQEIEQEVDRQKEEAIAKHMSDIKVMSKLISAINEYLIRFGRTSNVHDQLIDLKAQVKKNRDHLNDWVNKI
jgi:vacuolar-type H+-ATPase subunit I/STV1